MSQQNTHTDSELVSSGFISTVFVQLGLLSIVASIYKTKGRIAGLFSFGLYLSLVGFATKMELERQRRWQERL